MLLLQRLLGRTPERMLMADLRRQCTQMGVSLPRAMRLRIEGARVRILNSSVPATAPLGDGVSAHPLLVEHAIATKARADLLHARRSLALGLRGDADQLTAPWTRLVHPLALRMCLYDLGSPERGPYDWMAGRSGRVRDFHYELRDHGTIEFSRIMISDRDDPERVESIFTFLPVDDGVQRAQFGTTRIIPESVAEKLCGHPLRHLVEFTPSGCGDLDRMVGDLVMDRVSVLERSTIVTLAPTRWVPWGDPPAEWRDWFKDARYAA